MQTPIQKAIEDIKGYKAFGKTIDIDFVIVLLNSHFKEEKQDMKQTSIEWLIDMLKQQGLLIGEPNNLITVREAKEMHKQEIIDAFSHTEIMSGEYFQVFDNAEEYYQETFVSKGNDFKQFSLYEHKDTITSADTQVSKTFLENVPQQETLYTEEQVREAIEMARGIKDDEMTFDISSIIGCGEVCTYGWKEEYTNEKIIQSLKQPKL